jgi:hypothetical protein
MPDDEKKEDAIYRVDTVPPPAGESDAYNAPTRVGDMPPEVLAAMKAAGVGPDAPVASAAEKAAERVATERASKAGASVAGKPAAPPLPSAVTADVEDPELQLVEASNEEAQWVSAETEGHAPTRMAPNATPIPPALEPGSISEVPAAKWEVAWGIALVAAIVALAVVLALRQ